jgi:hypothetical protein
MQTNRKLILAIFAVAISGLVGATTEAQQPAKSGKYTGKYFAHAVPGAAQSFELEKGHAFSFGYNHGVFINDVADGFLNKSEVTCPYVADTVNGADIANHGYCVVIDKDSDKAFLVWRGKSTGPGSYAGTFEWTGGTGKFQGLQGNNNWQGTFFGKTAGFQVVWEGDWRLQ